MLFLVWVLVYIVTFRLDRNCILLLCLLISCVSLFPLTLGNLYIPEQSILMLVSCRLSRWLGCVLQISWRTLWSRSSGTPAPRGGSTWAARSRCCTSGRAGTRRSAPSSTPSRRPACPWSWPPTAGAGCTPSPWVSCPTARPALALSLPGLAQQHGQWQLEGIKVLCTLHSSVQKWVCRPEQSSFGKCL